MTFAPRLSDDEFSAIVKRCRSWRQVLREAGAKTTNTLPPSRRATALGLDTSHFTAQRRWTDDQLREAVAQERSWNRVGQRLGTSGGSAKRRAMHLGTDYAHLERREVALAGLLPKDMTPLTERLSLAGEALAVAWLQLAGCGVAPALGQQPYDILAVLPDGRPVKIQVKTSRKEKPVFQLRTKSYDTGSRWFAIPYSAGDIDFFFLIAAIDQMWLVPHKRVAGQMGCVPGPEYEPYRIHWPGAVSPPV